MKYVKRESWGYSIWNNKVQIGACVGLDYFALYGIVLTTMQKRIFRKRGVLRLSK